MKERDPILAAWERLAEKLSNEGLREFEVRFEVPNVVDYFALLWVETFTDCWNIVVSTNPANWMTYSEEHVEDLKRAAVYAADFVELVRRTHRILHTEATAIAAIDEAAT